MGNESYDKKYPEQKKAATTCDDGKDGDWNKKLDDYYKAKSEVQKSGTKLIRTDISREQKWDQMDGAIQPAIDRVNNGSDEERTKACQDSYADMSKAINGAKGKDSGHDYFANGIKQEAASAKAQEKTAKAAQEKAQEKAAKEQRDAEALARSQAFARTVSAAVGVAPQR